MSYFIGVDVGTSSVRACVIGIDGRMVCSSTKAITIWNPCPDYYHQSSNEIWNAVVITVRKCLSDSDVTIDKIRGIGFDATCSMVVLDEYFQPLTVSLNGSNDENIIMWMDHRAKKEVDVINNTAHKALDSVGGILSVEMQPPKLMWLKKNLPETWRKARHFFDLPDFLTWKATGSLARGMCSVVCKWSYQAYSCTDMGWDQTFFNLIGLDDLACDGYSKIGQEVQSPGSMCGGGLTKQASSELQLQPGTCVATSLIDAHAGALGCLSCCPSTLKNLPDVDNRLVLIAGTSTCHIICGKERVPVPGVWGPFLSAVVPGLWVNEGGQSSTGSLLDHVTSSHPAFTAVKIKCNESGLHVFDYLNELINKMAASLDVPPACLTRNLHVWPDFHGNRSPVADPNLCGMISGLKLSTGEEDLALLYLATVQALAYGTRHIVQVMEQQGHTISIVYLCGGLRNNTLYVQTHADVLGLTLVLPDMKESVMLGAAMLGANASGVLGTQLTDVMSAMGGDGTCIQPNNAEHVLGFHEKKYKVFLQMLDDQMKYKKLMAD